MHINPKENPTIANGEVDTEMAQRLTAAGQKAEDATEARRERTVKGSHLTDQLLALATGKTVEDKSGFHKITGKSKGRAVYLAKKGGRVDASGFTITNDAVTQISEEVAKDKHLGRVRGQIDFEKSDAEVTSAFSALLVELDVETPESEKPAKPPKAPKVEAPVVTETVAPVVETAAPTETVETPADTTTTPSE